MLSQVTLYVRSLIQKLYGERSTRIILHVQLTVRMVRWTAAERRGYSLLRGQ